MMTISDQHNDDGRENRLLSGLGQADSPASNINNNNDPTTRANLLVQANYSPDNQRYCTSTIGKRTRIATGQSDEHHDQAKPSTRRRSSFRDYIEQAFAFSNFEGSYKTVNYYFISSLLCLNVFLSILNTILLSFVVKSLQIDGDHTHSGLLLFDGKLAWDAHLESTGGGMVLDVPVSIAQGKFLSVDSIESHGPGSALMMNAAQSSSSSGQILISTSRDGQVKSGSGSYISLFTEQNYFNKTRPVEFVTDALLVNQLVVASQQPASKTAKGRTPTTTMKSRQLLELNARRQSVNLPLLDKIELYPERASVGDSLQVNGILSCDAGISGMLEANLDVQTRQGNLSCRSGRTLGLVSRSGKLNLAPRRLLTLDAPTLHLSAPSTKRLFISAGIKFVNLERQQRPTRANSKARRQVEELPPLLLNAGNAEEEAAMAGDERQLSELQKPRRRRRRHENDDANNNNNKGEQLHAYNLALVEGHLMAVLD